MERPSISLGDPGNVYHTDDEAEWWNGLSQSDKLDYVYKSIESSSIKDYLNRLLGENEALSKEMARVTDAVKV